MSQNCYKTRKHSKKQKIIHNENKVRKVVREGGRGREREIKKEIDQEQTQTLHRPKQHFFIFLCQHTAAALNTRRKGGGRERKRDCCTVRRAERGFRTGRRRTENKS